MKWWSRSGLRFKIGLLVSLVLVLVLGGSLFVAARYVYVQLWERQSQESIRINNLMVTCLENPMLNNRWDNIWSTVLRLKETDAYPMEDVALYAMRQDPAGTAYDKSALIVFVTGFPGGRSIAWGTMQQGLSDPGCAVCHDRAPEERSSAAVFSLEGQDVLRTMVPLRNKPACQTCHGTASETLGASLVDFRLDDFRRTAAWSIGQLAIGGVITLLLIVLALYLLLNRLTIRPLHRLLESTEAMARGEWAHRVEVNSGDEVGKLGVAFNEMAERLGTTYAHLQQSLAEREERTGALQKALDEVQQSHAAQDRLLQMIREMSTPVIPVQQGVLVMPLVGVIDTARAQSVLAALLAAVEAERARVVILDITGVPMVDTAVAQALLQAARAARLLGTTPVLVGITPQVAETIVSLGVDLSDLVTKADLQSGVEYALQLSRKDRGGRL